MTTQQNIRSNYVLTNVINKNGGFVLSCGTFNISELLANSYDVLTTFGIDDNLRKEILGVFTIDDDTFQPNHSLVQAVYHSLATVTESKQVEASTLWNEDIYEVFNQIAPHGYYFGSQEGNDSMIGWFKTSEKQEG